MTDTLSTVRHLFVGPDELPTSEVTEIYRSENGDLWELLRHSDEHCQVRHTPNPSSGGRPTVCTVEAFLAVNCSGPEHAALCILLPKACSAPAGR